MKLVADIVEFNGKELLNYESLGDQFVIEIPDVNPYVTGSTKIMKTDKQVAEEMEKVLGEYFLVVSSGPRCESVRVGDLIFMIPPQRAVSFKAKYMEEDKETGEKKETHKRFAIFKEHVVLGKLSKTE